jgi:plastocyanin
MSTPFVLAVHRSVAPLLAGCVLAVAGCGGGGGSGGGGGGIGGGGIVDPPIGNPTVTTSVAISGSAFAPPDVQVSPGATITFTNNDGIAHNVTFSSSTITSVGDFSSGSRTVTAPSAAGTYPFHCTIHSGMNGSVKVQ